MKFLIGLVGKKGSGKDTFCEIFSRLAANHEIKVAVFRFSDPIAACLDELGLEKSRENMQKFSPLIESGYGKGVFGRELAKRAQKSPADIVILNGVRWWTDVEELRKAGGILFHLNSAADLRFARSATNSEKPDEMAMARKTFDKQEKARTEADIPFIAHRADYEISNNGTLEELETKIREFIKARI